MSLNPQSNDKYAHLGDENICKHFFLLLPPSLSLSHSPSSSFLIYLVVSCRCRKESKTVMGRPLTYRVCTCQTGQSTGPRWSDRRGHLATCCLREITSSLSGIVGSSIHLSAIHPAIHQSLQNMKKKQLNVLNVVVRTFLHSCLF